MESLTYWKKIYLDLKEHALCLDIECTRFNGDISVVGLFKPKDGVVEAEAYVKDKNLTYENLKQAFFGCKLLITYGGRAFDVKKINQDYPGVLPPDIKVLDLYLFARLLGMDTNLKVMENTFGIFRHESVEGKRRIAVKLWKRYVERGDERALATLIEYNKQDTVNLYPLAEELMKLAEKKGY